MLSYPWATVNCASCPVIALCCEPTVSMAPPTAPPFYFHTGCPPTSRAMRAILQDLQIRIPPDITLTAASGSEQQQLHTQGSPPSSGWGVWSSTTYTRCPLTSPSNTAIESYVIDLIPQEKKSCSGPWVLTYRPWDLFHQTYSKTLNTFDGTDPMVDRLKPKVRNTIFFPVFDRNMNI